MKSLHMWIRGAPQSERPHSIRCTTPDGPKVIALDYASHRPFAEAKRTIETLHASRLEALDASGKVLRAVDIEPPEEEADDAEDPDITPAGVTSKGSEMVLVAQLLANAYKTGAEQHREFADAAYTKLVEITSTAFARLEGLERAWTRMLNAQTRGAFVRKEDGDEEQGGMAGMLQQFLANAAMGHAVAEGRKAAGVPAPSSAPNGAHTEPKGGE